jgi:hypothetical protein
MKSTNSTAMLLAAALGACAANQTSASQQPAPPLWQSAAGGFSPAAGSIAPTVPCEAVALALKLVATAADPSPPRLIGDLIRCSTESIYIGYLRSTLFIEGLDGNGVRLFVATGMNPLHQDLEAPPPSSGGSMSWHSTDTPEPTISTLIHAPITPALARLRWYDVDASDQPHLLGEMVWGTPAKPVQ